MGTVVSILLSKYGLPFDFFFKTVNVIKPATRPDKVQIRVILNPFIKMLHISVQIISDSSGQKQMK